MLKKYHKTLSFRSFRLALILITSLLSTVVNACTCISSELSVEERFNQADGVYFAVITSITTVGEINKNLISSQKLNIELTVYKTYKGIKIDKIIATGLVNLPFVDKQGELSMSSNSCDVQYFIGKEYTLITYNDKIIDLRMCSENIFNIRDLDKTERETFYRLTN